MASVISDLKRGCVALVSVRNVVLGVIIITGTLHTLLMLEPILNVVQPATRNSGYGRSSAFVFLTKRHVLRLD